MGKDELFFLQASAMVTRSTSENANKIYSDIKPNTKNLELKG